jgi:hypothetical protein
MTTLGIITKWPESVIADTDVTPLPLPYFEFAGQPRDGKLEDKATVQKILRRNRFTKAYPMLSLKWVFTQVEYYAFKEFYATDLGLGTASFRINLRWPFNNSLTEWVMRFMGEGFNARQMDGAWEVTADAELLQPFIMDDPAALEDWQAYISSDDFEYHSSEDYIYQAPV